MLFIETFFYFLDQLSTVSSCFLIDSCGLCGLNPRRGVCLPDKNVTRCQCFAENNGLVSYSGDFCESRNLLTTLENSPLFSYWPIIVGIVSSVAVMLLAISVFFCILLCYRARKAPKHSWVLIQNWKTSRHTGFSCAFRQNQFRRIWVLPRVAPPSGLSFGNVDNTPSETNSTENSLSRVETPLSSISGIFFTDLDQKLKGNFEPSETWSNSDVDDPIFKLDSIIDNDDLSGMFEDAYEDIPRSELHEFHNPNFKRI